MLLLSQTLHKENVLDYLYLNEELVKMGSFSDVVTHSKQSYDSFQIGWQTENDVIKLSYKPIPDLLSKAHVFEFFYNGVNLMAEQGLEGAGQDGSKGEITPVQSGFTSYNQLRNIYYIAANRIGPRNREERADLLTPSYVGTDGRFVINVLYRMGDEFIAKVSDALSSVMLGASLVVKPLADFLELYIDSFDNAGDTFRPTNVGFGYSFVLPIIIQFLLAPKNSILIVENPEAHLYPAAQSRLIDFMVHVAKENNLQVILETHSDHIVNDLRIATKKQEITPSDVSILYFANSGTNREPKIDPIRMDRNGTFDKDPMDFMDEWTNQLIQLV